MSAPARGRQARGSGGDVGRTKIHRVTSRISSVSRAAALAGASLLLLTGCWTATDTSSTATGQPTVGASVPPASASGPAPACAAGSPEATSYSCVNVTVTGAKDAEPTITLDEGFGPATALQVADVYEGSGTPVAAGDTLTVNYVGMGQQSGQVFDSSWTRGEPATFPLPNVIQGWQEGLVGAKPGGRRLLVIPGSLGYGPEGSGTTIGPDETLVFVVDIISATPAS